MDDVDINTLIYSRPLSRGDPLPVELTPDASSPKKIKTKKRRSAEAAARHRKKYKEILSRKKKIKLKPPEEYKGGASDTKSLICKYYYRYGSCVHGDVCSFSHDCTPITSKDIKLCKFYLQGEGKCNKSPEECNYSHDPSIFICRSNVINGVCNNTANCKFKHLSTAEIEKLDEAEKLRFCYNNKQFLLNLKNTIYLDNTENIPWYIRCVAQLDKRDNTDK